MDAYGRFSEVYDLLMEETPYEAWCRKITGLLRVCGVTEGLVLDIGCGTGTMTELLAEAGYDMIGIDRSAEMLQKAIEKRDRSGHDILYLQQDMRAFELYGTVRAAVSVCDSVNYLENTEELTELFRLVNNYLDPGGVFIFDLKTPYCFRELLADRTEAEAFEDAAYIWDNYYDEETRVNEYELTVFLKEADGRYERFSELHRQRAFSLQEILKAAREAGMDVPGVLPAEEGPDTDAWLPPDDPHAPELFETAERVYLILKEKGKKTHE